MHFASFFILIVISNKNNYLFCIYICILYMYKYIHICVSIYSVVGHIFT